MIGKEEALEYHRRGRPGKIEVVPTKPCVTQRDLSLAYTPGVAEPCLEIARRPRGRLPLHRQGQPGRGGHATAPRCSASGNIGALAGKPVMEGKGVLFKRFADIDVFDIEVDTRRPRRDHPASCELIAPTFGGINLEDIKAPECFEIEEPLERDARHPGLPRRPARHRDHLRRGPAQRARARRQEDRRGQGRRLAAPAPRASPAPSCYVDLGVQRENVMLVRQPGRRSTRAATRGHEPVQGALRRRHRRAARSPTRMAGADVFVGLSVAGLRHAGHGARRWPTSRSSSPWPTPTRRSPTRTPMAARADAIMATGRSDYPEPGQQRPRLPVHLPRRARRARHDDQRGDEAGGDPRPGRRWPRRTCPTR